MGLDITAYRRLIPAPGADAEKDWERYRQFHDNHDFPGRCEGLDVSVPHMLPAMTDANMLSFRAGSYGGYNAWRDILAKLAGYGSARGAWEASDAGRNNGPFWELINFSDCEGTIGPVVAAKLARDFAEWEDRARAANSGDDYWMKLYALWRRAFELAADGGAVDFH